MQARLIRQAQSSGNIGMTNNNNNTRIDDTEGVEEEEDEDDEGGDKQGNNKQEEEKKTRPITNDHIDAFMRAIAATFARVRRVEEMSQSEFMHQIVELIIAAPEARIVNYL